MDGDASTINALESVTSHATVLGAMNLVIRSFLAGMIASVFVVKSAHHYAASAIRRN